LNDSLNSSLHGRAASQAAACRWLESRQITEVKGAWSRNVEAAPGGWCFGDGHDHFPVTDCTAVSLLALAKHQPGFKASISAEKGVHWLLAMQHKEGGWSAYERYQGGQWLNKLLSFKDIPNALCDLPKADVSSKVVESLCEFRNDFPEIGPHLLSARSYLLAARTQSNLWRGNYGVNYIYGTAFAARALFAIDQKSDPEWAKPVRDFFLSRQNPDGGWGEEDKSYSEPRLAGKGSSGAVQTAWALMGLCAASDAGEASLKAIGLGCQYLLKQQKENGSWDDPRYLGTVFPEKVYFRYGLYPFYFPMLALEAAQKRLIKSL
jgi:squalene-hopene/tetraprenyl-beta-curcumene cyclase